MKRHIFPLAITTLLVWGGNAMAEPIVLDNADLDKVSAGTGYTPPPICPPEPPARLKGNNGWGNGGNDGINKGSFKGATALSKFSDVAR